MAWIAEDLTRTERDGLTFVALDGCTDLPQTEQGYQPAKQDKTGRVLTFTGYTFL